MENKPTISMIAAVDDEWNLAIDGKLPWERQLADKQYYLKKIAGHTIVMGSVTYGSADHSRTGNRIVVISRQNREELSLPDDIELISSVEVIKDIKPQADEDEIFITGGGSIYTAVEESIADRIYLNIIHTEGKRNGRLTKFPALSEEKWQVIASQHVQTDKDNQFSADFNIYERLKP